MARQRLRVARTAAGLSLRQLSRRIGGMVTAQAISYYERGETTPSQETLAAIAKAVGVSAAYLAGDGAAMPEGLAFRKLRLASRREEGRFEALALQLLERYLTVEELLGRPDAAWRIPEGAPWPVSRDASEAERAASALRESWGLDADPLPDLVDYLEARGIMILPIPLPAGDGSLARMRGRADGAPPVIALNAGDTAARRRFAVARELGHMVLEVQPTADAERIARRFARAFLMPADTLRAETGARRRSIGWDELFALKRLFGVDTITLSRRCEELGIFGQILSRRLSAECTRRGWRGDPATEPGAREGEHPRRFERLYMRALSEGAVSEAVAAELFGVSARDPKRKTEEPPADDAAAA